jgi:hypothetical protein
MDAGKVRALASGSLSVPLCPPSGLAFSAGFFNCHVVVGALQSVEGRRAFSQVIGGTGCQAAW